MLQLSKRALIGPSCWALANGLIAAVVFCTFSLAGALLLLALGTYVTTLIYLNASVRLTAPDERTGRAGYSPQEFTPLTGFVNLVGLVLVGVVVLLIVFGVVVLLSPGPIE